MGGHDSSAAKWYLAFCEAIRDPALAPQLRSAADGAQLRPWTELLTAAVVRACGTVGWTCAAKGSGPSPLPVRRAEYLGIDVLAFGPGAGWHLPMAAFELENSSRDYLVGYALWKACSVRAQLACLFCYRRNPEQIAALVRDLQRVLGDIGPESEVRITVGTRASAGTFPDDYFRPFSWNQGARQLVALPAAVGTRL